MVPLTRGAEPVMNAAMTERIRLIIDTEEEIRLAVRLAATKADISPSQLVNALLRKSLAAEIEDAKKYLPRKGKKKSPDAAGE